ncbi:MAG: ABC transporter substrate-binding protein [Clostridia bacterium]|nr:ABC transporter substrate-binding protein [Clostridia bacterium]
MKKMVKVAALMMALMMLFAGSAMADSIKIAVIGPFTGPAANYGLACRYGAQVAADEINAQGGLQIELIFEDDEHDTEKAINAYNAVMEAGAQMIDGTTTTNPCLAVSAVAYEERVFMLTPSASNDGVVADKDNMYQVCFQDPVMGTFSADMIAENGMGTKVAVIYNNADDYSTTIFQSFKAEAEKIGLEIVSETTFAADDNTDFTVQVADAKDKGADLVFLPIYYTPASNILRTAKSMDYAPVFFGVDGMDGILAMDNFDASLAEDVILLTPFSAFSTDEQVVNFVEKYMAISGGVEPNQFGADSYDAIYALYQASVAAGITGETSYDEACELLIEQFSSMEYVGLTGDMKWDETGAVSKEPAAYVIKGGAYVPYGE